MSAFCEKHPASRGAFSLVEVVLSLGVLGFAMIAILGVVPMGLRTGHAAQDETRSAQIAQDILASVASQVQVNFPNCTIRQAATSSAPDFSYDIKLDGSSSPYIFAADNDGHLVVPGGNSASYPYEVSVFITPDPSGFDPGYATIVTVRVAWRPFSENIRSYVRIVSKF